MNFNGWYGQQACLDEDRKPSLRGSSVDALLMRPEIKINLDYFPLNSFLSKRKFENGFHVQ